jgi:adenylyltransferase/sulfurtransferase
LRGWIWEHATVATFTRLISCGLAIKNQDSTINKRLAGQNLQRQILHTDADVGRPKVISAKETLNAHNPDVNVVLHEEPINSENAMDIIPDYDIIVNGADNFATRYLVNDASVLAGKPLVDGAILVFDGQATTYQPGKGCYRCMFPDPPPQTLCV